MTDRIELRLTPDDVGMLDYLVGKYTSDATKATRSGVVRLALRRLYDAEAGPDLSRQRRVAADAASDADELPGEPTVDKDQDWGA